MPTHASNSVLRGFEVLASHKAVERLTPDSGRYERIILAGRHRLPAGL